MTHSKTLEETALWKTYQEKLQPGSKRAAWIREIYDSAAKELMNVRQTFINYTLHDQTHILNVMDAMGGILGDQAGRLTACEAELLILAASLHDLGMVYTPEEKEQWYSDRHACREFLREHSPELLTCPPEDWPEEIRQWYLRAQHPFRIHEVLQHPEWQRQFARCPHEVVSQACILAVCQAHGQAPEEFQTSQDMEYLPASDADPLFCALLLRLADALDFDDTRAPGILYRYAASNEKSREEWKKHQASAGFRYPETPSATELPYKAKCTDPGVEHTVRDFLNWIDEELDVCIKLQKNCHADWQRNFPFPRAISRKEIESDGYMSGDFRLTMDQTKILELLTGKNLYESEDVFVRELLQNAIDATLLRGEVDEDFSPEKSRIDLWEWNDKNGDIWFRIDDQGTGMTLGMLQRYFLKVGNSYYTSQELERDLRDYNQTRKYCGISRFGIGFLSCFLCGNYAEISTVYFDPRKNRREEADGAGRAPGYGLRLQVTGLTGYYTLKNQAKRHMPEAPLSAPEFFQEKGPRGFERGGYRAKAGTSIAVRLDPGKLGALELREAVKKYLCGARVPVYYNGERIGRTYGELMKAVHEAAGKKIYELSPANKKAFDASFPRVRGQYPQMAVTVIPLDTEKYRALPGISGVIVKYDICFDKALQWEEKDQAYEIRGRVEMGSQDIVFFAMNKKSGALFDPWINLEEEYGQGHVNALAEAFMECPACPASPEQLGDVWKPFEGRAELYELWRMWVDDRQENMLRIRLKDSGCLTMESFSENSQRHVMNCCYRGIAAGELCTTRAAAEGFQALFLLDDKWQPVVDAGRARISALPLESLIVICGILGGPEVDFFRNIQVQERQSILADWRKARTPELDKWLWAAHKEHFREIKNAFQEPLEMKDTLWPTGIVFHSGIRAVLSKYLMAYFQDTYQMTIDYDEGEVITFQDKDPAEDSDLYDIFPPMMFCKAANEESRRYLCSAGTSIRRGITADHPFARWLLENAERLNRFYPRQLRQIIHCLCSAGAEDIIQECSGIRRQLVSLPEHHGIDMNAFPQLSEGDFWYFDDED